MKDVAYFVCATPRTGSSLLLGLLDSTGVCGHPQAYFRAPDEPLWAQRWQLPGLDYAEFVRAARTAGSTPNGVFGAKLMWGTLDELVDKLRPLHPDVAGGDLALLTRAFGRTRFVHLRRRDVLAQAVSWLRAEQSGTWFLGGHGEITGDRGGGRVPVFDAAAITRLLTVIEEHNAGWEAWFSTWGVRPHRVDYEDLAADMTGTTRDVLAFLGINAPMRTAGPVARHRRQADRLSQQWIEQYRAAH